MENIKTSITTRHVSEIVLPTFPVNKQSNIATDDVGELSLCP